MPNQQYRYQLDASAKKYSCPNCQKRRFVLYLDVNNNKPIADYVGRCDREDKCQYHYTPKQFIEKHPKSIAPINWKVELPLPPPKQLGFIPEKYLYKSMYHYEINPLVTWLHTLFDTDLVKHLIKQFYIGTSKKYGGSTVFWQVDTDLKIRQAKIMHYDKTTGRRNKQTGAFFAGKSILKKEGIAEPNLQQCLFGLHQLNQDGNKIVAIVESEKTAILMQAFSIQGIAPNYTWLATGGKTGCKWKEPTTWQALKNRTVILYPDLGAYEDWKGKAKFIGFHVHISDLLYLAATKEQREDGLDVADFFLMTYANI